MNLRSDHIEAKPREVDWSEAGGEYGEGFTVYEAIECDECGAVVIGNGHGEDQHRYLAYDLTVGEDIPEPQVGDTIHCPACGEEHTIIRDEDGDKICPNCCAVYEDGEEIDNNCGGYICSDGPMMNYFYPCTIHDPEDAARKIADLPLCVVAFEDGETGLALTGGGMDLSWEICAAYIALGYLPPVHFGDLPRMANWENEPERREILEAMARSLEVVNCWNDSRTSRTTAMLAEMRA